MQTQRLQLISVLTWVSTQSWGSCKTAVNMALMHRTIEDKGVFIEPRVVGNMITV